MTVHLLIDGKSVPARGNATFDRLDPAGTAVATTAAAATADDARDACAAAARAFPGWARLGPNARRDLLLRAADALAARVDDFAALMRAEIGATRGWAAFNVKLAAGMLREAAAMTTQITGEVIPSDKPGTLALAVRQPAGVCLGIAPWNAPVILAVRAIAMPLACGNSVILKASEICPATHRLIGAVLDEAGLPAGVVNVLTNAPADAAALVATLVAHPAVRRVNFTGSTHVGRIIAELAARHLKPALLELGGKAPLLVLDDADLDAAVDGAAFGAFMNQGQICMSTERIVVDSAIADDFAARLTRKAAELRASADDDGSAQLGTLVSREAVERVAALIADAVAQGATLLTGGASDGPVMQPAVLDHVTPAMRIYREESFGPVVTIVRATGDDALVEIANDSEFGLSSAVFARDIRRAIGVAQRVQAGICHINGPTVHDEAQMPFGGVKDSGYGRFGGKAAIAEFTDLRWITIEDEQHYPF